MKLRNYLIALVAFTLTTQYKLAEAQSLITINTKEIAPNITPADVVPEISAWRSFGYNSAGNIVAIRNADNIVELAGTAGRFVIEVSGNLVLMSDQPYVFSDGIPKVLANTWVRDIRRSPDTDMLIPERTITFDHGLTVNETLLPTAVARNIVAGVFGPNGSNGSGFINARTRKLIKSEIHITYTDPYDGYTIIQNAHWSLADISNNKRFAVGFGPIFQPGGLPVFRPIVVDLRTNVARFLGSKPGKSLKTHRNYITIKSDDGSWSIGRFNTTTVNEVPSATEVIGSTNMGYLARNGAGDCFVHDPRRFGNIFPQESVDCRGASNAGSRRIRMNLNQNSISQRLYRFSRTNPFITQ